MNYRLLALAGLALLGSLTGIRAAAPTAGPGMTLGYHSAIKDMDVNIENARLPDGTAFPHCGGLGGPRSANENVLADTSITGVRHTRHAARRRHWIVEQAKNSGGR